MAETQSPKIENVRGPQRDKVNGRYILRWTEDGKERAKTSKVRSELLTLKNIIAPKEEPRIKIKRLPARFTGKAEEWKKLLCGIAKAANDAARVGDKHSLSVISQYEKVISSLSASMLPHSGYVELEQEFEKQLKYIEDLQRLAHETDAAESTALTNLADTLSGNTGPDKALSGSSTKLPN